MLLCYVIDSGLSTSLLLLATLIIMFYIYIYIQNSLSAKAAAVSPLNEWQDIVNRNAYRPMFRKLKNWFKIHINTKINQFYKVTQVWSTSVNAFVSDPAHRQNERWTDATITWLRQPWPSNNRASSVLWQCPRCPKCRTVDGTLLTDIHRRSVWWQ